MKKLTLAFSFLVMACASQNNVTDITGANTIQSECPTEGTCKLEVLKDKSLLVQSNDIGKTYYNIQDTPGKTVIRYTYNKNREPLIQDAGYSEEVIFDTDSNLSQLKEGMTATKANLFFGVQCFCKDRAGYYKPQTGNVILKDNLLHITLPANIVNGQLTNDIQVSFKK
jgi:hypothetical protein